MRLILLVFALAACQSAPSEPAQDAAPAAPAEVPVVPTADRMAELANVPDDEMDEAEPAGPEILARGRFTGAGGHDVSGEAILYRLDDGSHLVRLEGLESDNGPDLKVWLVRSTTGDVGRGAAALGALKSVRGDQNYPVPAGVDPADFAGVSIWCERFSVNFGAAPLAQ